MALKNQYITFHIGMPKTASTTLQKYFASGLQGVHYFGPENPGEGTNLFLDILNKEALKFDEEQNVAAFKKLVDDGNPVIMSSEFGCGLRSPYLGGMVQPRDIICERLYQLAPQARILIILRNQLDLHKSFYAQTLKAESEFLSLKKASLKKWIERNIQLQKSNWPSVFEFAEYYELIRLYQSKFDRVEVVFFEDIIRDMEGFVNTDIKGMLGLTDQNIKELFVNNRENVRYTKTSIEISRMLNKWAFFMKDKLGDPFGGMDKQKKARFLNRVSLLFGGGSKAANKEDYTIEHREYLINYYADSNRKLAELLGKDLKKLGYPA